MSDVIIGAIVGALAAIIASIVSGVFSQILNSKATERRDNRQNLINACEDAKKLIFFLITSPDKIVDDLIINTRIKLSIFASEELSKCFDDIIHNIKLHLNDKDNIKLHSHEYNDLIVKFTNLIKKELNIKK
jgi:gas vesicle protein